MALSRWWVANCFFPAHMVLARTAHRSLHIAVPAQFRSNALTPNRPHSPISKLATLRLLDEQTSMSHLPNLPILLEPVLCGVRGSRVLLTMQWMHGIFLFLPRGPTLSLASGLESYLCTYLPILRRLFPPYGLRLYFPVWVHVVLTPISLPAVLAPSTRSHLLSGGHHASSLPRSFPSFLVCLLPLVNAVLEIASYTHSFFVGL